MARRISVSHWRAFAAVPARAADPPTLVLHELVLGASRSIDRHEVAVLVLLVGLLLFAVVTAILLFARARGWRDWKLHRTTRSPRCAPISTAPTPAVLGAAGDGGLAAGIR